MIQSPLMFYKKLRANLESKGFKINPYDPCIANKMGDGMQITIIWHVDDFKVSHREEKIVDQFCGMSRKQTRKQNWQSQGRKGIST